MNWKTAKTYADAPHEYVLANEHPETYRRFSQPLKQAGVMESFTLRGKTAKYRYYTTTPATVTSIASSAGCSTAV